MMLQNNISFDTYFGRVLDPECYKFINILDTYIQSGNDLIPLIKTEIFQEIRKFTARLEPPNKNTHTQQIYFMFMKLLKNVLNAKVRIKDIFQPKTHHHYLLLKSYLIPLLDILIEIKKIPEYHNFAYEYILNYNEDKYPSIYIIRNENECVCDVINIPTTQFEQYLKENKLCFNLSGALFKTHENKMGILNQFLTERLKLRKEYKTKRDTYPVGSTDYQFYDRRQLAMKINANSSYGLTGMSSFLFSNRQLAMSTTLSGRLCLKISQACGDLYLNNLEKELI